MNRVSPVVIILHLFWSRTFGSDKDSLSVMFPSCHPDHSVVAPDETHSTDSSQWPYFINVQAPEERGIGSFMPDVCAGICYSLTAVVSLWMIWARQTPF